MLKTASVVRVLVLSDTHGVLDPRIASLAPECDYAVHAGDIGCRKVVAGLSPRERVVAVRGNNDNVKKWPTEEAAFLASLPDEAMLELPGGYLVVVHGHRGGAVRNRHQWLRRHYPEARLIAYGHSHRTVCDRTDRPWVVNPGAAGRSRTFGGPSCVILEASVGEWRLQTIRFELSRTRHRRLAAARN